MSKLRVPGVSVAVINGYKIEWAKGLGYCQQRGERTPVALGDSLRPARSANRSPQWLP